MNELFRRLFRHAPLAVELLTASLFVNLLSLASPIFVIQILNRYVAYGFDGTLVTLTTGMVVASLLLFAFSVIRNKLAVAVCVEPDRQLMGRVLTALARAKAQTLYSVPRSRLQEAPGMAADVQAAYVPPNLLAMVDLPFSVIFLVALLLLSWPLALVTLAAMGLTILSGWLNLRAGERAAEAMRQETMQHKGLVHSAIIGAETVRAFLGAGYLGRVWNEQLDRLQSLKLSMSGRGGVAQSLTQTLAMLLRVGVYALGAYEVVQGNLTVGGLIGASILSAKALQQASGSVRAGAALKKAATSMRSLSEILSLPQENHDGAALKRFSGGMAFRDAGYAYPGAVSPLFEKLNFELPPGTVLLVTGDNGAGKTTFCKLVAGLYEPLRGQVLADGVDLRQFSPLWWRRQVMYVPQDPGFLHASMRDNLTLAVPEATDELLNAAVRAADLKDYLDSGVTGLQAMVAEGGTNLPMGIRKRLALARALMVQGRLAVLDEPTEGMDTEGCAAVYAAVNGMIRQGVTVVLVTRDINLAARAGMVLELSAEGGPQLRAVSRPGATARPAAPSGDASAGNVAGAGSVGGAGLSPAAEAQASRSARADRAQSASKKPGGGK